MSKAVLLSIKPQWCELIASGQKTIELRKTCPQLKTPFKCYIYCTKNSCLQFWVGPRSVYADDHSYNASDISGNGKVIGEFVCDAVYPIKVFDNGAIQNWYFHDLQRSCVPYDDIASYIGAEKTGYGWHISDLVIYGKPKELSELYKGCAGLDNTGLCWDCEKAVGEECDCAANGRLHLTRPPQSWCYVEELEGH